MAIGYVDTANTFQQWLIATQDLITVANNAITYTTGSTAYNTFKTFSIKVVMSGSDTTDVPKVRDLRAIALPSGT